MNRVMENPYAEPLILELIRVKQSLRAVAARHGVFQKEFPLWGVPQTIQVALDAMAEAVKACEKWSFEYEYHIPDNEPVEGRGAE